MYIKTLLSVILFNLLISCSTKSEKKLNTVQKNQSSVDLPKKSKIKVTEQINYLNWKEIQDSLRTQLLNSKPNTKLKSSMLQELYIRGLVKEINNRYEFILPFDLHGFDCGAPDCYSTDIAFDIPAIDPIEFPKKIQCKIVEHGCVDEETISTGTFVLKEQTKEYVNYYSTTERCNLLIFGRDKRQEFVYYFSDVEPDTIKAELISELLEEYNEEDPKAIVPYRITIMIGQEYDRFF